MDLETTVSVIGILVGVVGSALAIYLRFRDKTMREFTFITRSFALLDPAASSLESFSAEYRTRSIPSLVASKILLWNCGNVSLSGTDITSTAVAEDGAKVPELTITLGADDKMLGWPQVPGDNFVFKRSDDRELGFSFKHLNPGDGCLLTVWHHGSEENLDVRGSISDARIRACTHSRWKYRAGVSLIVLAWVLVVLDVLGAVRFGLATSIFVVLGTFALGVGLSSNSKKAWRKKVNDDLRDEFESHSLANKLRESSSS